jgi:hypothetical protein
VIGVDRDGQTVVEQLRAYWACIERLSAKNPTTLTVAAEFLSDGYVARFGDLPLEAAGTEMIQGIAMENDAKWVTQVEPIYVMVDEKQQMAAAHFTEKLVSLEDGAPVRVSGYFTHIKYRLEQGRLKLESEHIVEVPSKFKVETLAGN